MNNLNHFFSFFILSLLIPLTLFANCKETASTNPSFGFSSTEIQENYGSEDQPEKPKTQAYKKITLKKYVNVLASIQYDLKQRLKKIENNISSDEESISFSEDEIENCWQKIFEYLDQSKSSKINSENFEIFLKSYESFLSSKKLEEKGLSIDAKDQLLSAFSKINKLWKKAVLNESKCNDNDQKNFNFQLSISNLTNNPLIKSDIRHKMEKYLIPNSHPMKPILDKIFSERVTKNKKSLINAGFKIIDQRKRSFISVVSHPLLKDYLLKLHYDSDSRKKQKKASWYWMVKRCEGAEKIQSIIKTHKIKYFVCAHKWIYVLPIFGEERNAANHLVVLLVTDMKLIPSDKNYYAWSHKITKNHLDELYLLVTRGKGSSYRPDNMPFTESGKIAFIDTEYPDRGPDFSSIRKHLDPKMRLYWDHLIKNSGPMKR